MVCATFIRKKEPLKVQKKDNIILECVVSKSTAKHILKGVLVTKGNLKSDLNTISDFIRVENMLIIIYIFFISYEV